MGVEGMRHMEIPAQDRNRTSPFPYGGHRFEFRAVGSAQNVSLVNTVLNTITANAFKEVADRIEGGEHGHHPPPLGHFLGIAAGAGLLALIVGFLLGRRWR